MFAIVYFKFSLQYNQSKGKSDAYYRLAESYHNADGRVCHRTILNIGFIEGEYSAGQLNQAARILTRSMNINKLYLKRQTVQQ